MSLNKYKLSCVFIILLVSVYLAGCYGIQKNVDNTKKASKKTDKTAELFTEKSTYSKYDLPIYEIGLAASLKDGDPDAEVRQWHQKNKKPFQLSERFIVWKDFSDKPEWGKWLEEELWKWEWRDGWEPALKWEDKGWVGSWYLIPIGDKVDQTPPRMPYPDLPKNIGFYNPVIHDGKEWPFGAVEGEFWYWRDDHWELGPAW